MWMYSNPRLSRVENAGSKSFMSAGSSCALDNLTEGSAPWQCCSRMAQGRPKSAKSPRPERIRVPNREPALLTVDGHNLVGILQRLSLSGGSVIHTEQPFPRGTLAGLALKTVFGKVTASDRNPAHRSRRDCSRTSISISKHGQDLYKPIKGCDRQNASRGIQRCRGGTESSGKVCLPTSEHPA